jgi:3-deoxy-manno-octulosonate cytidylyltransferase (CMP-KDO synthetase)
MELSLIVLNSGGYFLQDWLLVVPARLHSTRLPKKALQDLGGAPLIVQVCQNLKPMLAFGADILVATDSPEIMNACESFGFRAVMTSAAHKSGTDRIWEASKAVGKKYIMNVQGDEPFVALTDLRNLARQMELTRAEMGTLGFQSDKAADFASPNVVKIVVANDMHALYFSRSPIPHLAKQSQAQDLGFSPTKFWHHQGVYAFTKATLERFCQLPPGRLESIESLEQLRALENGIKVLVVAAENATSGIDTAEDLEVARAKFR